MVNNANKRIVRVQNNFDDIEAMRTRSLMQCMEIGTDGTLLCAALSGIDSSIASAQIIFGSRLYFGKHKAVAF